jgi:hypothetical protein
MNHLRSYAIDVEDDALREIIAVLGKRLREHRCAIALLRKQVEASIDAAGLR